MKPETWLAAIINGQNSAQFPDSEAGWRELQKTAARHGVTALCHYHLTNTSAKTQCPGWLCDALKKSTLQIAATETILSHELIKALEELSQADIQLLLMKGTPLAHSHYPETYLREKCDTDILLQDKATAERAWRILEESGYKHRHTLDGDFVGYQYSCFKPITQGIIIYIDVHIKLNDYIFFAETFDFDELYSQSIPVPALGESIQALKPVHALLLACMHRVAHIPRGEADRLVWLYDIHLLVNNFSEEEWEEFATLAEEKNICGSCMDSIEKTKLLFPINISKERLQGLIEGAKKERFKPHEKLKRWEYYYLSLKAVPGFRRKMQLLREHFLPSSNYIMEKYQTRNRLLLPFLYVHRVLTGLKKYF